MCNSTVRQYRYIHTRAYSGSVIVESVLVNPWPASYSFRLDNLGGVPISWVSSVSAPKLVTVSIYFPMALRSTWCLKRLFSADSHLNENLTHWRPGRRLDWLHAVVRCFLTMLQQWRHRNCFSHAIYRVQVMYGIDIVGELTIRPEKSERSCSIFGMLDMLQSVAVGVSISRCILRRVRE